ncbi:MAG: hypothetical protein M3R11_01080 [Acidobacteriota bacterium]|nr:hypothetical protein [Acidobacteriota bacterium]
MKQHAIKQTILLLAVIICGFAVVFGLSNFLEKNRPALPADIEDADLALQGAKLKGYALGFEGLLADWYWMKSLQYIGDKILKNGQGVNIENMTALNPRLLYPYLNNATDLDPKFMSVYEYGATVLPGVNKENAIKLTEKGIENNPNNWRLYQYLGYIYWRAENYEKAAEVYRRGSQIADAPGFMKSMAAKMNSEGGSRATAREIYEQVFAEAQDEQVKENAALRLLELDSMDERDVIKQVLQDFQAKNNRCPTAWREILPLLQTRKLPAGKTFRANNSNDLVDPSGAPYILDAVNCAIKLNASKTKIPLK